MASSASSQFSYMDPNEAEFAEFIKEQIEKGGGRIAFQQITGRLYDLPLSIRQTVGATARDLSIFLKTHSGLFTLDPNGFVSFEKSPVEITDKQNQNSRRGNSSNTNNSQSLFPMSLNEVPGIVIKVLPTFGFIAIKHPVKTSVYFTPANVIDNKFKIGNEKVSLLTDIPDMLPGKKVIINAKKADTNFEAKYRATRVWTPPNVKNQVLVPEGFKPKVPKDGLYDPVSIDGSGKVQKVFEQFGFITCENPSENIFFHKSKVCNFENIMNLAKVFSPGDLVEFKAIRSTKNDIKVKWEASKVWVKKQGKASFFKHDSGLSELDSEAQKSDKPTNSSKSQEVFDNLTGKVFPHNDGIVIKFGKNDTQLADADSCPFYLHGEKVQDICWEFSSGDAVNFNIVKIKSAPGFKATLAWVGEKPSVRLPEHAREFAKFSDEENVSATEKVIPGKKNVVPAKKNVVPGKKLNISQPPPGFSKQPNRGQHSKSSDRSRIFTRSSQVSNASSRSASKSRSSVDKDCDLHSEDTLSTISGETQPSSHHRRRRRRPRGNASKSIHKVNSRSSLTDDTAFDSDDTSYSNQSAIESHNSDMSRDDLGLNMSSDTLKPGCSLNSLDLTASLKPNPDLYQNWGDSPYLEDDNHNEPCPDTKENTSLVTNANPTFQKNYPVGKNCAGKGLSDLKQIFPSDDEFSDAEENFTTVDSEDKAEKPVVSINESPNTTPKATSTLPAFEDIMNASDSETVPASKLSHCVKCFFDLEGKILKVYCKYAEIESNKLRKEISVLWNDLYHNGVPVSDKFDDMKEVIKPGQAIHFNCIEIVDDDGAMWQKVTMAWKGQKPRARDMTPQEYIKKNYLRVSVDEIDFDYGQHENPALAKMPLGTAEPAASSTAAEAAPPRRFLSVVENDGDENEPEAPPPVQEEVHRMNIEVTPPENNELDSLGPLEDPLAELGEAIHLMISSMNEQDDKRAITSNILNLVRSMNLTPRTRTEDSEPEDQLDSIPLKTKNDSETQTIVTGDVIAQSIFTL